MVLHWFVFETFLFETQILFSFLEKNWTKKAKSNLVMTWPDSVTLTPPKFHK